MSGAGTLRQLITERLAAVAEEIFGLCEQARREEIARQPTILDVVLQPDMKPKQTELPRASVTTEEEDFHLEDHPRNQGRHRSQFREEPATEPPPGEGEQTASGENKSLALKLEEMSCNISPPFDCEQQTNVAAAEPEDDICSKPESDTAEPKEQPDPSSDNRQETESAVTRAKKKRWKCLFCSSGYDFLHQLKAHMRIKHSCDTPFRCDTCGKMLKSKSTLNVHIRSHSGEKPYKCTVCGNAFTQKNSLKMHLRTHTGERPHTCSDCGKRFSQHSNLIKHIRVHTREKPYSCSQCEKAFAHKWSLKRHNSSHTGEKPFKCDTCGKGFFDVHLLKGHMECHERQKQVTASD